MIVSLSFDRLRCGSEYITEEESQQFLVVWNEHWARRAERAYDRAMSRLHAVGQGPLAYEDSVLRSGAWPC